MGIRAMNFVKDNRRAGGFAQAVLAYLADCMNDRTGRCFPLREKIAEYFSSEDDRCTVKRVERALARLRTLGFIESKRVPYTRQTATGQEGGWQNSYVLVGFIPGDSNPVEVTNISGVTPKTDVTPAVDGGHPQNVQGVTPTVDRGHPHRGGIKQKEPERTRNELESSMRTSGNSSAIAAGASAQAQTPYPEDFDQSLFDEAMLATQDSEQAPEALPDPDADLPPKKQRRSQQPRVPFPETLPDDWAEAAKIARPDIDPQRVFLKLRARYAPTTTKKTLATWKREFMNWIGKEFAYDNRYRSSAQKPQRTLGATDTRSLNHRNFGKWASHAV